MDNDEAGEKTTARLETLSAEVNIAFMRKNDVYLPHKDVNAFRMQKLKLSPV